MRWIKEQDGSVIEYHGPAMGYGYYQDNGYIGYSGVLPLDRLEVVDGEVVELPEPDPVAEWVSKEVFLGALYELVPAEQLATELQDPETFKSGVMGLALLTTDAAPGGEINLLDERVPTWLAAFGLTLEQVREKMAMLEAE